MIPVGNGKEFDAYAFSVEEFMEFIQIMNNVRIELEEKNSNCQVGMVRAFQFMACQQMPYNCSAGNRMIVVDEKGNVMPCRRLPIKCGNILQDKLSDIYYNHAIMKDLRDSKVPNECGQCRFKNTCAGGAKCLTYAVTQDYHKVDPLCPLVYYNRNNNV
jgi:radical SAM protein with 4Fe4S-binding SPASM domain